MGLILQANPDDFDVDTYLKFREIYRSDYWRFSGPLKPSDISLGDVVFIWRADGSKKEGGGIIGLGRVTGTVTNIDLSTRPSRNLWRPPVKPGDHSDIVPIEVSEVRLSWGDGMVPRALIEGHPPMDTHIMFKLRVKSTYKISEDQERFLLKIWDRKRPK